MSTAVTTEKMQPYDRVLEVGAGTEPDARASTTADLHAVDCDHQFDVRDAWPFDDATFDGLIARHVLEHISRDDYPHVFGEAARVLKPGGTFEFRVPVGSDQGADLSHKTDWAWRAPDLLVDPETFWIGTPPFELVDKQLRAWMCNPMRVLTPVVSLGARLHPNEFWYELPGATGELTVRLRRVER